MGGKADFALDMMPGGAAVGDGDGDGIFALPYLAACAAFGVPMDGFHG